MFLEGLGYYSLNFASDVNCSCPSNVSSKNAVGYQR